MLPITVGGALPTGLTLAARVDVNLPCLITTPPETDRVVPIVKRALVGIVPASNGNITFFDAVRMRPFDLDAESAASSLTAVDSTGTSKGFTDDQLAGFVGVEVLDGVTQSDVYRLVYQLGLPDLGSVDRNESASDTNPSCPPDRACFAIDATAATRVEVDDVVVLRGDEGTCKDGSGTEVDYKVTAKVEGNPTLLVTTRPAELPEGCAGMPRIIVRASGTRPVVVTSDNRGFLGRLGELETLELDGAYYYRRTNVLVPAPKDVRITLKALGDRLNRGDQFVVTTLSHFRPYVFGVDTTSLTVSGVLGGYRLPGPVVYTRVGDADFAYIAYPSADGILQVSLEAITDNIANTTGLVPFE